ncbi:MAG: hypothetical protein LWW85_13215 [Marinilabiliales bacterium]|nr:hypothetical protein [Marinilabiliales bacterium]
MSSFKSKEGGKIVLFRADPFKDNLSGALADIRRAEITPTVSEGFFRMLFGEIT